MGPHVSCVVLATGLVGRRSRHVPSDRSVVPLLAGGVVLPKAREHLLEKHGMVQPRGHTSQRTLDPALDLDGSE